MNQMFLIHFFLMFDMGGQFHFFLKLIIHLNLWFIFSHEIGEEMPFYFLS